MMYSKIKIILDPGILKSSSVDKIIRVFSDVVRLIVERRVSANFLGKKFNKLLIYPDFQSSASSVSKCNYSHDLWLSVIDDHQTFMLYDRENRNLMETNSIKVAKISTLICLIQEVIKQENPSHFILTSSPHNIRTWIFSKVCAYYGVKIFYFQESPLPWRYFLFEGLGRNPTVHKPRHISNYSNTFLIKERLLVQRYLAAKIMDGNKYLAKYESDRAKRHKGMPFNLLSYIRDWYHSPWNIINAILCFNKYRRLSSENVTSKKFAVFFMHFQPERSTLPEGYGFAQQLMAIKALRTSLPEDVILYVKEHPSTFRNVCSWRERTTWFYEAIVSVPGVRLISLNADTYELMSRACVISTITGTVAFEAVMRSQRVVYFGVSRHTFQHENIHIFTSMDCLSLFLEKELDESVINESAITSEFFDALLEETFSGISNEGCIDEILEDLFSIRKLALERGILCFLNSIVSGDSSMNCTSLTKHETFSSSF